ncbi:MAG TPA: cytochrome b/b6 domain-containing protein, partial [Gammaproteobacteria bacterium]
MRGNSVRVWDLPLRLFHWLLVAMFALAWWSKGHAQHLDLHLFAGYTIMALLLFRLAWGFTGTHHARFRSFAYGKRTLLAYLRDL